MGDESKRVRILCYNMGLSGNFPYVAIKVITMQNINTLALIIGTINNPDGDVIETYAPILANIIEENHSMDSLYSSDIINAIDEIDQNYGEDFTLDFDGAEYRIINNKSIWDIYVDTIKQIVEDCYKLNLDKIPSFISVSVDWEQTAHNAYVDGYGHTFSGYDGSELECGNYYIFRTN